MPDWDTKSFADKIVPGAPGCVLCKDVGWHERAGELQWCLCEAGDARKKIAPTLLLNIQIERDAFARKFTGEHV